MAADISYVCHILLIDPMSNLAYPLAVWGYVCVCVCVGGDCIYSIIKLRKLCLTVRQFIEANNDTCINHLIDPHWSIYRSKRHLPLNLPSIHRALHPTNHSSIHSWLWISFTAISCLRVFNLHSVVDQINCVTTIESASLVYCGFKTGSWMDGWPAVYVPFIHWWSLPFDCLSLLSGAIDTFNFIWILLINLKISLACVTLNTPE